MQLKRAIMTIQGGGELLLFIVIGADIPEVRMFPGTIVEHLDVSDDIVPGLFTGSVRPM